MTVGKHTKTTFRRYGGVMLHVVMILKRPQKVRCLVLSLWDVRTKFRGAHISKDIRDYPDGFQEWLSQWRRRREYAKNPESSLGIIRILWFHCSL